MNVERIEASLRASPVPLCRGAFLEIGDAGEGDAGEIMSLDPIACLLRSAGVEDWALRQLVARFEDDVDAAGIDEEFLWRRFGSILEREYGITSPEQVADLMNANDEASDDERLDLVLNECRAIVREARR